MFWAPVIGIVRSLFFSFDKIIYDLIGSVYGLLLQICRTSVFDTDAIHSFSSRIYVFIGLFMLFKLSISLITYLLNPDDFSKGEKSFGTIVKNAIFALVMVVLCPYIFTELFEIQSIILEENTIMNIAFGTPNDSSANIERISNSTYADSAGEKIKFTLAFAFAQPNYEEFSHDEVADLIDCKYTYEKDGNNNFKFRKRAKFDSSAAKDSNYIYSLDPSCWGIYDPDEDKYIDDGINGQLLKAFDATEVKNAYQDYAQGVAQQSYSLFFKKEAIVQAKTKDGRYVINYRYLMSTIVGIGTLYLLLMYCIDLAVRSVKLGFLQMIAPIPILSYVDPKAGKDGMFNKWFKACKNTYLDLFIRLFALYFGIYVITLIGKFRDVVTGEIVDNWIVNIFMILGVLIFIKKLPEFLKETLGFEGSGTFKGYMNPLKKIEDEAFLGKNITGAAAGLAGGVIGAASGAGVGRIFTGTLGGALNGKGLVDNWKTGKDRNKTMRSSIREHGGLGGIAGRLGARVDTALGLPTRSERYEARANRIDERIKDIDNRLKPMNDSINDRKAYTEKVKAVEDRAVDKIKNGEAGVISANYKTLENRAEQLREAMRNGTATAQQVAQAEIAASDYLNTVGKEDYINNVIGANTGARAYTANGASIAADATYRQADPAMTGQYHDLEAMVSSAQTYTHDGGIVTINSGAIADAATMHSNAGQVSGSIAYDTRNTINPGQAEKQSLEQEKSRIYDDQRRAKADESAIK